MPATEIIKSSPKYLVVDDEMVRKREREAFIRPTRLSLEDGIFVETYEEALEALKSNPNIIFCFIDIRIPRNKQGKYDKDERNFEDWQDYARYILDLKNEYGARLLSQIKAKTVIFSAYAELDSLKEEAARYAHVVDFLKKPFKVQELEKLEPYLEGFEKETSSISTLPQKSFDYSLLDEETLSFVQLRTVEIRKLMKRSAQDIFDIGNYLNEVKNKLGHGKFLDWVDLEFNWSSRTANRFMSVAQKFESDTLSNLELLPSALYLMAAPSTPEEAVAEALERAQQGETITAKTVKEIKAKHKTVKEQAESKVKLKKDEQVEPERSENRESRLSVDSVSQPLSGLPEKRKIKQEILAVVPSEKAVKNSWWQLGENNRLFCGEPKSSEFLKRLPKDIGLSMTFLPKGDLLVPPSESIISIAIQSKDDDIDLDRSIETLIRETSKPGETIVFNYLYYVELLELTEKYNCNFWVAEPDLTKCERILTMWRQKGSVTRITS